MADGFAGDACGAGIPGVCNAFLEAAAAHIGAGGDHFSTEGANELAGCGVFLHAMIVGVGSEEIAFIGSARRGDGKRRDLFADGAGTGTLTAEAADIEMGRFADIETGRTGFGCVDGGGAAGEWFDGAGDGGNGGLRVVGEGAGEGEFVGTRRRFGDREIFGAD